MMCVPAVLSVPPRATARNTSVGVVHAPPPSQNMADGAGRAGAVPYRGRAVPYRGWTVPYRG